MEIQKKLQGLLLLFIKQVMTKIILLGYLIGILILSFSGEQLWSLSNTLYPDYADLCHTWIKIQKIGLDADI